MANRDDRVTVSENAEHVLSVYETDDGFIACELRTPHGAQVFVVDASVAIELSQALFSFGDRRLREWTQHRPAV